MTRQRRWSAIALIAGVLILIVGISRLPTIRASSVVGGSATKSPITSSVPTATVLRPPVPSVSSVDIEPKGAIDLLTTPLPIDNNDTILVDRTCTRLGSGTVTLGVHMVNLGQAQVVIDSVVPEQPLMVLKFLDSSMGNCNERTAPWHSIPVETGADMWVSMRFATPTSCVIGLTVVVLVTLQDGGRRAQARIKPFGEGLSSLALMEGCQR